MSVEHFCTLFDSAFLPTGLCLIRSLARHVEDFSLHVLCMDDAGYDTLVRAKLPRVVPWQLAEIETPELQWCRATRRRGEYCWTLTPFLPEFAMRKTGAERMTYLDSDIFFFRSPRPLLEEFERSGTSVFLTEANFSPDYDFAERDGRFCVQYLSFRNDPAAHRVLRWWQERCLEWCYDRREAGLYGDQKYLDEVPTLFAPHVSVSAQKEALLAPWNLSFFRGRYDAVDPIFFHFSSFRLRSATKIQMFRHYRIPREAFWLYEAYLEEFKAATEALMEVGWRVQPQIHRGWAEEIKCRIFSLLGRERSVALADRRVRP